MPEEALFINVYVLVVPLWQDCGRTSMTGLVRPNICMILQGKPGQDIAWHVHLLFINNKEEWAPLRHVFLDQRTQAWTRLIEERRRWRKMGERAGPLASSVNAVMTMKLGIGRPPTMYEIIIVREPSILLYRRPVQSSTTD
ncbi:hypothetical protein CPC08DRAFT_771036 [Agrocybe pediades]|nr:hypothetical protein CPC08DRAFT_771036 [Agrocybe pediades]